MATRRRHAGIRRQGEVVAWKVTVPISVALEVELLCTNKALGRPTYGIRSQLITRLLIDYLNKTKEQDLNALNPHPPAGAT